MKTNNEKGRNIVLIAAVYLIVKEIINTFIGGGLNIGTLLMQVLIAAALISGLKFVNIGAAVILIAVAVSYLPGNLANIGSNFIYLLEGVLDIFSSTLTGTSGSLTTITDCDTNLDITDSSLKYSTDCLSPVDDDYNYLFSDDDDE